MACCLGLICMFFCCNDTATTEIYTYCHTLSLHDACPISIGVVQLSGPVGGVTDLQWRRPTTGTLVRVVTAEQATVRSEEHTSELQSLMRFSYAVFCLKKTTTLCAIPVRTLTTHLCYYINAEETPSELH